MIKTCQYVSDEENHNNEQRKTKEEVKKAAKGSMVIRACKRAITSVYPYYPVSSVNVRSLPCILTNLHQVVLQDVSDDAVRVEVPAAALGPEIFLEGDLHRWHAVAVSHVLEHHVGEAKGEHVLHHFFAQVVDNPEKLQMRQLGHATR
jgi:hypothetical protein